MGYRLPAETWHYELLLEKKEEKLLERRYFEDGFADCVVHYVGFYPDMSVTCRLDT